MPYQTYLELCMIYYGFGLKSDALLVLDKAPAHPEITLWKAFLTDDASKLNEVALASPAYVFPYRTESLSALNWAVTKNTSWKFKYYLALNNLAAQRDEEAMKLFIACGQDPDYSPFYLARAALLRPRDEKQELADLQTAARLSPDDWRSAYKLIDYYDNHQDYKMTLTLATEAVKKHKANPDVGVQYAIALINNGQYAKSLKTLEGMNILPSEGARLGKIIFENACLYLSMDLMKNKKYSEAIKMIEKSKGWPENLGVGKPYEVETRIQDYLQAFCLDKVKRPDESAILKKSIVDYTNQDSSPSFNNILALNILKEKGDAGAASSLIQKIENSDKSNNIVNQWVIAKYNNDQVKLNDLEKHFSKNSNYMILKRLMEVTSK
jgi:tetratricopeptide (TPR) repeat protein